MQNNPFWQNSRFCFECFSTGEIFLTSKNQDVLNYTYTLFLFLFRSRSPTEIILNMNSQKTSIWMIFFRLWFEIKYTPNHPLTIFEYSLL